jgi:protein-S-isoprenylcysteine O-methyltransferase Ste14
MFIFFKKSGNQLFRYRGQIPIILVLIAIIIIYNNPTVTFYSSFFEKKWIYIITISLILLGHLIRALTIGYRNLHTSGKNRDQQVAHHLNTLGMYSIVRHPLYLGNFFIWLGIFVWVGNLWFLMIGILFFMLLYFPIIQTENTFLASKFGVEYIIWAKKTPLILTNPLQYKKTNQPFSFKMVWKNEYPGIVSTLACIWFVSFLRLVFSEQKLTISIPLLLFALSITIFGFGSRFLKHKTDFFPRMG